MLGIRQHLIMVFRAVVRPAANPLLDPLYNFFAESRKTVGIIDCG